MNENSERWKHDGLNDVYYTTTGTETHKHVDTKTHQSTTISQVHHIKVIPRKDSGKVDDQGKPVPKLEFIHIPYNGGQAVTTAAARKGVVWGACHYGSFQEWECPEKGSGDWRFGYNPYRATYRQGQRPWLLPPKDFENHPYQGADQFVVARNPYERAISFYRQVYDEEHGYPHGFEKHHQPSQQSLYLKRREDPERMNRFLTSHFVNVARDRIPLRETDLPPQVMFVDLLDEKTKKVSQQYTIKYENLQDNSFRDLMKRYHLADDPLELPPPARQEGAIYLSSEDLVGSTLVLLNILYRRDFRAFNYTLINPRMEFEIALELAVNVTAAEDASDAENFVKPNLNALEYIPIPYTVERDMTIAGSNAGDVWGACHWGQFDWYNCPFGSGHLMLRENRYIRYKADNYPQAMEPWHVPLYQFRDAPLESSTLRFTVVMNPYRRAIEFYRRVYDQRHGYPHGFPMENSRIAKREGDELPKSDEIYLEKRERADSLNEFLQKILMPFHTPLLPNGMEMLPQFHYIFQQTSERTFLYVNEALHWENLEKEWTTRVIEKENISMTIELPAPPSLGVSSGVPNVHLLSIKDLTNKTIAMLNDHYKVDFQYLGYKMKQTNIDISSFWHPVLPSKEVRAYAKGPNSMAVIAATRPSNNAPTKGEIKKQTTVLPLTSKETDAIAVPYGLLPEEDASTVGSRGVEDRKKILQQEQDALPIDANEQANGSRGDIEDLRNALLQNRKNAGVPSNAGNRKRRHSNYKKALRLRQARARTRLTKKH